ncbi:MAG: hypothetical protein QOH62_324 [Solirubrobacteraceae bacterium]|jgi:uncharacterized glyoxalase superfamily protein PhnB|nr:hypothetical protein [Solirubrobacteraceae bacterium]
MSLYPSLRYRDAPAAIDFLCDAFGFERHEVFANADGTIAHAELSWRGAMVMLGTEKDDAYGSRAGTGWTYVAVEDPDAHHDRAKAAGAEIVRPLEDQEYGSRDYSARDPEGNLWSFGTYDPARV